MDKYQEQPGMGHEILEYLGDFNAQFGQKALQVWYGISGGWG